MKIIIKYLKSNFKYFWVLSAIYTFIHLILSYFRFSPAKLISDLTWFFRDFQKYQSLKKNKQFSHKDRHFYPCLTDKTESHEIEPIYFYQNSWAAKKIFDLKPKNHVDVGSSATAIGLISQYFPTTMVDIRPLPVTLTGLSFVKGSILKLPFKNNSLETLSSVCVVEHIGLGRYGDKLDQFGSEKAIKELKRVVKKGGHIIITVPIDAHNHVHFNAHRTFTREYIVSLFSSFKLVEEKYIYGMSMQDEYDPSLGFGTGLYLFKKK